MPELKTFLTFGLVVFGMILIPGPNMLYLISRSVGQGRMAGYISLGGIVLAFVFYMLCTVLGITALLFAIPHAYDVLRFMGAVYMLYLAWQVLKPGGHSLFKVYELPSHGHKKLFTMGFLTSLFNPKVAMIYLSLLPQFIEPQKAHILEQSLLLGVTHILISIICNGLIVSLAGYIAVWFSKNPRWISLQRGLMGGVFLSLALRMALDRQH